MRSARLPFLAAFGFLAAMALFVTRTDAMPETVRLIAPGVWFREGDLHGLGHSNNIVIEMKDYLIVVDANFPSGARALLSDARRIAASKPVKYVFDTHHHGDHAYGNALFTRAGATSMAFKGAADEMQRVEPKRWQETAAKRKDVAELGAAPEPPQKIIDENIFVLDDGKRKVEFRFFGWAHTRGDGFVYLPKEQVLCTGDAVVNGPHNYMGDANVAGWPEVIRAAAKLKVKHVLPGHGEPGGRDLLTGQERFLTELYKAVKAGADQGKAPDEIAASLELPENVRPWVGDNLKRQVAATYEQIKKTP